MPKTGFNTLSGLHPRTRLPCDFYVSEDQLQFLYSNGHIYVLAALRSAAEVLLKHDEIYHDLKRDGQNDGYCYIGKPRRYGPGWEGPPSPGLAFYVFVTCELIVFEWGWEKEPLTPKLRFGKKIWPL